MHHSLHNVTVREFSWAGVNVTVPERRKGGAKTLVQNMSGNVQAGEMLAILGPSGSGKTTLLNVLAHRSPGSTARVSAQILLNKQQASASQLHKISRFVETEDVLIGALTVRETLSFAAKLGLGASISNLERTELIEEMLNVFGLAEQAETIVGTLAKRGISTGQKRRLRVAAQLISAPRILFLDEPTSGLDSAASFKVMSYLKDVTKAHNLLVICSIHQPSSKTFELFDTCLMVSGGKMCYSGAVTNMRTHFDRIGFPIPMSVNPAEFVLDLINIDFESDIASAQQMVSKIHASSEMVGSSASSKDSTNRPSTKEMAVQPPLAMTNQPSLRDMADHESGLRHSWWYLTCTVIHRSWIKSRRDVMVYGVRLIMYMGLAILMGTVWLRLPASQDSITPLAHCILFGSTFSSFMGVVYVPAFLEDYSVFVNDRDNGLYGTTTFLISNILVGIPYLFILAFAPATFTYWMVNFRPDGTAFAIWVLWSYLNLLAAEGLVVLVTPLIPHFISSVAAVAMVNSVFMACNGFMLPRAQLNVFYRYVFYYINYQSYVYRGLSINEYQDRSYDCGSMCECRYAAEDCQVDGRTILQSYGFDGEQQGVLIGIMLGIIVGIRVLGWASLRWS